MTEETFELPDKRKLGYALYGAGDGQPVIYFHGTPGSRLEPTLVTAFGIDIEAVLQENDIRLIAFDRPGMGLSGFNPSGDFVSFANDVVTVLRFLKIPRTKVLCWSGGGPFALAIANHFPHLVEGVFIISGFTLSFSTPGLFKAMKANKFYFAAAKKIPAILRFGMNLLFRKGAKRRMPPKISGLPTVDYTLLTDAAKRSRVAAATVQEACRQGSRGAVYEAQLYFKDPGYRLPDISQPVHFWWGTSDKTVIRAHAEAIETQVPKAMMHYKKDEGHLSIYVKHLQDTLRLLSE